MIINRIIDNAGVAMAAINRGPVVTARAMAMAHPPRQGQGERAEEGGLIILFGVMWWRWRWRVGVNGEGW